MNLKGRHGRIKKENTKPTYLYVDTYTLLLELFQPSRAFKLNRCGKGVAARKDLTDPSIGKNESAKKSKALSAGSLFSRSILASPCQASQGCSPKR